jgi:hypothetical protein
MIILPFLGVPSYVVTRHSKLLLWKKGDLEQERSLLVPSCLS